MRIDLNHIPFSRRNSYMVISQLKPEYATKTLKAGLYLRTVHGSAERSIVARLTPLFEGKEADYATDLELTSLVIASGEQKIEICFHDENTLLFRGNAGTGMKIDFLTEDFPNDYIYDIKHRAYTLYMANCYKNNCRYLAWALKDSISMEQQWEDDVAVYSRLSVLSPDGFMFAIQEVEREWNNKIRKFDFDLSRHECQEDFLEFLRSVPSYPLAYQDRVYQAAYLQWSSYVRADGFLSRDTMLISKNWLTDKTGWNHSIDALALSYKEPKRAWEEFILMFDFMDDSGRLPDSFNDSFIKWNHVKPPIHGWALSKMMEHMDLRREQLVEAYLVLKQETRWWMKYRNFRHEGLYIYDHAKDSGWDHSTVFSLFPPIASPELQAFLIVQMDLISRISGMLGIEDDHVYWKEQADILMNQLLTKCFRDNLPVAIHSNTHEIVECESLLPYLVLVLGERLPESIRAACIKEVCSDRFKTPYGLATESPSSPLYRDDKKWRGPIWPLATYIMIDGLKKCGAEKEANEIAAAFADLAQKNGLSEGYDARTGRSISPNVFAWSASIYLLILNECFT